MLLNVRKYINHFRSYGVKLSQWLDDSDADWDDDYDLG